MCYFVTGGDIRGEMQVHLEETGAGGVKSPGRRNKILIRRFLVKNGVGGGTERGGVEKCRVPG